MARGVREEVRTLDHRCLGAGGLCLQLIESGIVRSVAIEIDIGDIHAERARVQMRDQTAITVVPLLRLIENLQKAGMYDRTLILISTTYGGRAPAAATSACPPPLCGAP